MAQSGSLHTIQENHAIREAVISFTVTPQIINPAAYGDLLKEEQPFCGVYHKFEPIRLKEVKIEEGLNTRTVESVREAGFKFIAFKDGKTSDVIQGLSQPRQGLITFNTVNYSGWTAFLNNSLSAAAKIAAFQPVYTVRALSLMFIDEFYFENGKDYNPKQLFNLESRNLPKGIEDSDFVDFNFNLRRNHESKKYFENVSIKVFDENHRKTIRITDNLTFEMPPVPLTQVLDDIRVKENLDYSHKESQKILRDILTSEVVRMIGL